MKSTIAFRKLIRIFSTGIAVVGLITVLFAAKMPARAAVLYGIRDLGLMTIDTATGAATFVDRSTPPPEDGQT